jgi:hypothetical protein
MNKDNQDSSPLRLLACSVLFVGIVGGGLILVMWGIGLGIADDFENGISTSFITLGEPIGYIAIGIMVFSAVVSMLILRKLNSVQKTK